MKQYGSIPYYKNYIGHDIIAFDKLDGSNIRFEWSRKRGFYKFGTRKMMIDRSHKEYGFAIDLFMSKYAEGIDEAFEGENYEKIPSFVCFAELVGDKSAFGKHDFENDDFDIVLFDIDLYKKGIIPPKQFVEDFKHLRIPRIIYEGELNEAFIDRVKSNEFSLSEGVVCKGVKKSRKEKDILFSCKIKTDDWFERLKNKDPYLYDQEIKESSL
jgi:hypothetical protein